MVLPPVVAGNIYLFECLVGSLAFEPEFATTYTGDIEWWLTPKMSVYPTWHECDLIWQMILADVI